MALNCTVKQYSDKVWSRLVKERDVHCRFEGCKEKEDLEAHHIIPRSQGGENILENGITLCREHHRREYLRDHLHAQVQAKTTRLFSSPNRGKKRQLTGSFQENAWSKIFGWTNPGVQINRIEISQLGFWHLIFSLTKCC